MKGVLTTGLILAMLPIGSHAANCTGTTATQQNAASVLGNHTVCATNGSESWQEYHTGTTGGDLVEYALGPSDPVDPTHLEGTWSQSGNNIIYNYTGGSSYTFELWLAGGTYYFCDSAGNQIATVNNLIAGTAASPCP